MVLATPLFAAVPIGFALLPRIWTTDLLLIVAFLGAVGWVVALALRGPVSLVVRRRVKDKARMERWVVLSSGPLEEFVRLGLLLLVGTAFATAYSLGLGWATVEVAYAVIIGYVTVFLARRTDDQAVTIRELLRERGVGEAGPFIGVVERASATALHIGFTLLIAWQPILVLVTAAAHSGLNLAAYTFAPRSIALVQILLAAGGGTALFLGLAAFGLV